MESTRTPAAVGPLSKHNLSGDDAVQLAPRAKQQPTHLVESFTSTGNGVRSIVDNAQRPADQGMVQIVLLSCSP